MFKFLRKTHKSLNFAMCSLAFFSHSIRYLHVMLTHTIAHRTLASWKIINCYVKHADATSSKSFDAVFFSRNVEFAFLHTNFPLTLNLKYYYLMYKSLFVWFFVTHNSKTFKWILFKLSGLIKTTTFLFSGSLEVFNRILTFVCNLTACIHDNGWSEDGCETWIVYVH